MNAKTNTVAEDAQEAVVLFDNGDVEANTSPDAADEVAIDATSPEADEDEEVLEDAAPAKKHGFFSTKKAVFGAITLGIVAFTAVAVGGGVAGARAKNNKDKVQEAQMMILLSGGKSKTKKDFPTDRQSPKRGDIFSCVIEPALTIVTVSSGGGDCVFGGGGSDGGFDADLPTTGTSSSASAGEEGYYTRDDFEKDVWKPYLKACGEFWGDVFYLKLRFSELWCAFVSLFGGVFCTLFGPICDLIGSILSAIWRLGPSLFMTASTFSRNCMVPTIAGTPCENAFSLDIGGFAANPEQFLNDVTTCAMSIGTGITNPNPNLPSPPPKFPTPVFDICSDEDVVVIVSDIMNEMGVIVDGMVPVCMEGGEAAPLAVPTLAANVGAKLESMSPVEAAKARVEALKEIDVEAIAEIVKGEFPSVNIPKGVGMLIQAVQAFLANLGN